MFDLPSAKRVRRADLSPSSAESSPDPTDQQTLHARLSSLYGPISAPITPNAPNASPRPLAHHSPSPSQAHEFEFRLFSTSAANPPKIVLQDEPTSAADGGFVQRERDRRYYFSTPSPSKSAQYTSAALSGAQILHLARKRAWGLEVPWRVTVLSSSRSSRARPESANIHPQPRCRDGEPGKKTKPGKKRRIWMRNKRREREGLEEMRRVEREKRDEAEREKRTRRNREKKVKRKMKEKAKKIGDGGSDQSRSGTG